MKKYFLLFLSIFLASTSKAQLSGDGYYRVQNRQTERYVVMIDNKSQGYNNSNADIDALLSVKPFTRVVNDPSSVIYIENVGNGQYNLKAQGTDAYQSVGYYLSLKSINASGKTYYQASATAQGVTLMLYDKNTSKNESKLATTGSTSLSLWDIQPISSSADNYVGLTPEFSVGGKQYTSFFASFPYTFSSSGMKAYTVSMVDGDLAVWQEVSGKIAASTPVIIQCAGTSSSDNKLNLEMQDGSALQGNLLKGAYFNNTDVEWIDEAIELSQMGNGEFPFHFNATAYDPSTMRLLGVTSQGKLGFVKSNVQYVPRNRAYLKVTEGTPDEITLVTQEEYEQELASDAVVITARDLSRSYGDDNPELLYDVVSGTLKGQPAISCSAVPSSTAGTYPIVLEKGTLTNRNITLYNGTLTVSRAPLTIAARSYTIYQNEPLPTFELDCTGFKLGETLASLTQQPVVTCDVPAEKTPGTYAIAVSGAESPNYDVTQTGGILTILKADPITITAASIEKEYGDDMPQLTYTVSGGSIDGLGTPKLSCEATAASAPGSYVIRVEQGSVDYPNLVFVDGMLTVTPATLIVTADDKAIKQNEPLPAFTCSYEGFKLGQTADVLVTKPTFSCDVPEDKSPGTYTIEVGGASADCYVVKYFPGTLTITEADLITITASSLTMAYGDDLPQLTYTVTGGSIEGLGMPVISTEATKESGTGVYVIKVEKGTVDYPNLAFADGTLTVTPAPLTISAGNYTMKQDEERPTFKATFQGFKLGQNETVLTKQPVLATDAPDDNTPGEYEVTISGAEADNYDITYVSGKLIISAADEVIIMAVDAAMTYGDAVPQLTYTISDETLQGVPVITCEATSQSPAGTYPIIIGKGTVDYPNVKLVNGTLTIDKAPLTVSVGNYVREEGRENPVFELTYQGFRNGDDESVLTVKPVAATTATANSPVGTYDIVVSGGR